MLSRSRDVDLFAACIRPGAADTIRHYRRACAPDRPTGTRAYLEQSIPLCAMLAASPAKMDDAEDLAESWPDPASELDD